MENFKWNKWHTWLICTMGTFLLLFPTYLLLDYSNIAALSLIGISILIGWFAMILNTIGRNIENKLE